MGNKRREDDRPGQAQHAVPQPVDGQLASAARQLEAQTAVANRLLDALLCLRNRQEAAALLEDLCTIQELQDMRKRLQVAGLLKDGHNYQEIGRLTAMSTATISRVNRSLRYGAGGYELVLARLDEKKEDRA